MNETRLTPGTAAFRHRDHGAYRVSEFSPWPFAAGGRCNPIDHDWGWEKALAHFQRSLEVLEKLLPANPDSAQAARDVVVHCERLAALAEQTG